MNTAYRITHKDGDGRVMRSVDASELGQNPASMEEACALTEGLHVGWFWARGGASWEVEEVTTYPSLVPGGIVQHVRTIGAGIRHASVEEIA